MRDSKVDATSPAISATASPWKMGSNRITPAPATTAAVVLEQIEVLIFNLTNTVLAAIAGTFILLSLELAYFIDGRFLWFTAFVGANLLQSAFTRWCLMENILRKLGWDGVHHTVTKGS